MSVATRCLLLLRHAEASQALGTADHDRPLSERGQKQAAAVGVYLAQEGLLPELAVVSTARRTRTTWDQVRQKLPQVTPVEFEPKIYEARPEAILDVIHALPAEPRCVLLLGHNPGMHAVALQLAGSGDQAMRDQLDSIFPPGSLAVIEFDVEDWSEVGGGNGQLARFAIPSD